MILLSTSSLVKKDRARCFIANGPDVSNGMTKHKSRLKDIRPRNASSNHTIISVRHDEYGHIHFDSATECSQQMSKEQILQEILQELKEIRKSVARFDEFILELAPSEAQEEIKNLE